MATPDPTITTTPGKNEKVNNVLNIEDVLRKASGGVSDVVSAGSAPSPEQREKLAKIQQLAANLEQELRALRAAMPENSGDPPQLKSTHWAGPCPVFYAASALVIGGAIVLIRAMAATAEGGRAAGSASTPEV